MTISALHFPDFRGPLGRLIGKPARHWRAALVTVLVLAGVLALGEAAYIKAKAVVAQIMLQDAWAETQAAPGAGPVKPWSHADTWPIAQLTMPRLGIDQIVLAGASGRTLAFGPAHLGASMTPGGPGNAIISGHRDTHFAFLAHMVPGDVLTITTRAGVDVTYEVSSTEIVHIDDAHIPLVTGRPRLTLVTCYPFDAVNPGTPYHYIVTAEAIPAKTVPAGQVSQP